MNEKETDEENKWIKMEYDIAKSSTTSGVNARLIFLGFLITVNLAFYKGFYDLYKEAKFNWLILLCFIVTIINVCVSLIYVREHRMQEDNHNQIWKIRKKLNQDIGNEEDKYPDWFKWGNYKDPFKGWTYGLIAFILSFLISTSLFAIVVVFLKISLVSLKNIWISIMLVFLFLVFLVIFFLLGKSLPEIGKES